MSMSRLSTLMTHDSSMYFIKFAASIMVRGVRGQTVIERDQWESTVFISKYAKSSSRRVICKLCGDVLTGGATRLKAHYSWVGSKGKDACKSVTEDLWIAFGGDRARYISIMGALQGPISEETLQQKVQEERAKLLASQPLLPMATGPSTTPRVPAPNVPQVADPTASVEASNVDAEAEGTQASIHDIAGTPCVSTTHETAAPSQVEATSSKKRARSSTLQGAWAPSLKKKAEIAEERFFYQCNLAFHVACTSAYKRFVNAVSTV